MPPKDWIKVEQNGGGRGCFGINCLSDPAFVVKSMMWWGYNPNDVQQDEEELIFVGERKTQMEITCDSFAAIIHTATAYLSRCKKMRRSNKLFSTLDNSVQNEMVVSGEGGSDGIDVNDAVGADGQRSVEMTNDAAVMCVVWAEVLHSTQVENADERDGMRSRKRRLDEHRETSVNRLRICAALLVKKVDDVVPPSSFTFTSALKILKLENLRRFEIEHGSAPQHGKPNKQKAPQLKKSKTFVENAMQLASDRELHRVHTFDQWLDVGRANLNQRDSSWLIGWDSAEAHEIMRGDWFFDRMDPFLGPGASELDGTVLEKTRPEDFFSFSLELCRRPSEKCAHSMPKCPEQLQDVTYLMHCICPNGEPLLLRQQPFTTCKLMSRLQQPHVNHNNSV